MFKEACPIFQLLGRFWYHKKAHIFLTIHDKYHSKKVFRLEEINEKVSGYGNSNKKLTQ